MPHLSPEGHFGPTRERTSTTRAWPTSSSTQPRHPLRRAESAAGVVAESLCVGCTELAIPLAESTSGPVRGKQFGG